MPPFEVISNRLLLGHKILQGWEIDKVLEFSYKRGINEAVEGIEDNGDNYRIYSVLSSEDSFVHSQTPSERSQQQIQLLTLS